MSVVTGPISYHDQSPRPGAPKVDNYLTHDRGFLSWALTLDHKRIALLYMAGVFSTFFLGGMFALMMRTMLLHPLQALADGSNQNAVRQAHDLYNHFFTLHGAVMVFMFIIPVIPAIMGNFILPMQLGAKDVAFPRLNLLSFYCWCGGGIFFLYLLISGVIHAATGWAIPGGYGLDTGWTFYTPYSDAHAQGSVVAATLAVFMLGFSSILTGVNFIATIHMLRPKGMTWFKMPLFLWALYATSMIQILATPVLAITVLLLCAERSLGIGIFDPALGGDPILFQHFFWFYSHPAVYIMILPAMGVISELIVTFSRKHIFGYSFIAMSSVAIAMLSFFVWGHHMFISGQSAVTDAIFSLITFAVAIPSAVKIFNWLATLYKADIRLKAPMLYALGFMVLFTVGGLTGLFLGTLAVDVHLTGTYFIVAHFHYVMMGSTLFALIGGMYYWGPKMFGRMYNEKWAQLSFWVVFVGFNLTFFPQFIAGTLGMPRRYASYLPRFTDYHVASSIGAYVMATGLFLVLFNWIHALRRGKQAPDNPWGANTLEWRTSSPPPHDNFKVAPVADDPYNLFGWIEDPKTGAWTYDAQLAAKYDEYSAH
jgi:cytochrome c oxidase subunit I